MAGREKGENKEDNSTNDNPEVASPNTVDASRGKKNSNIPTSNSQEISKPSSGSRASPNFLKNVTELEGGYQDDRTVVSNTHKTKEHSFIKMADNASEKKNIQENENTPFETSTEVVSKKKRRRRRGKSKLDTSGPFENVQHEVFNPCSLNRASGIYKNWKAVNEKKALLYREDIFRRILQIELESTETTVKKLPVVDKSCYPETGTREDILCSKEEKEHSFSDDDSFLLGDILPDDNISIRPVIFVKDKATQTDSVPVTTATSNPVDVKSSTTKNSYSDFLGITKPTESDLSFTAEITEPIKNSEDIVTLENKANFDTHLSSQEIYLQSFCTPNITDPATDDTSISKSFDGEEIAHKPGLGGLFLTKEPESNSDKTIEEMQPKTDSELVDNFQKKSDYLFSSTCSRTSKRPRLDSELQSISKSPDIKNSCILKPVSDGGIITKPNKLTLHLPDFEIKTENVLMDIANFPAEADSPSNIISQSNICSKTFNFNKSETLNISESTNGKNSAIIKSKSEGSVVNVPTKLNLTFSDEENTLENSNFQSKTDSFPNLISFEVPLESITKPRTSSEPLIKTILKPTDGKNSTLLKSELDDPAVNKPTESNLHIVAKEIKPGTVSDQTTSFQNKTYTVTNLSSSKENLKKMTEELLVNLDRVSKDLEESFSHFLKLNKNTETDP